MFYAGQIELYTHHRFFPTLVSNLNRLGIRTCAVYLLESQFMEDKYKFFRSAIFHSICDVFRIHAHLSGVLSAMSAMVNFEIPWINIMTKMDLVSQKKEDSSGARISFRKRRNLAR